MPVAEAARVLAAAVRLLGCGRRAGMPSGPREGGPASGAGGDDGVHRQAARGAGGSGAGAGAGVGEHDLRRGRAGADRVPGAGPRKAAAPVTERVVETRVRVRPPRGHGFVGGLRHSRATTAGPQCGGPARKDDRSMTSAAIYARVSSARQKKDETIGSQTAALRAHAEQLGLDVPEEWVFEDEGHSGATLVRPGAGAAARPGRRGRHRRGAVLLAGPAGPQVRLPGVADRGVHPRRHPGGVRQGPARRPPGGSAAGAVPGHVRRVREGADPGTLPARQDPPRPDRVDQRALRRPVRLPVRPQERRTPAPPTRSSSTKPRWSPSCSAATPTTAPRSPTWPAGCPTPACPPAPANTAGTAAWSGACCATPPTPDARCSARPWSCTNPRA